MRSTFLTAFAILASTIVAKDAALGEACTLYTSCTDNTFCSTTSGTCGGEGAWCKTDAQCIGTCNGITCVASKAVGGPGPVAPPPVTNVTHTWVNGTMAPNCTGKPTRPAGETPVPINGTVPTGGYTPPAPVAPGEASTGDASVVRMQYSFAAYWVFVGFLL